MCRSPNWCWSASSAWWRVGKDVVVLLDSITPDRPAPTTSPGAGQRPHPLRWGGLHRSVSAGSSSARPVTSRKAARSPSWPPLSSRPALVWTRSSSRSSRAPATGKCGSLASWPTTASSRPSTSRTSARVRKSCWWTGRGQDGLEASRRAARSRSQRGHRAAHPELKETKSNPEFLDQMRKHSRSCRARDDRRATLSRALSVGHSSDRPGSPAARWCCARTAPVASVDIRGGAPGTLETALLSPFASVTELHGILLTGGSAPGLGPRPGYRLPAGDQRGYQTPFAKIPLVSAAVIYDLGLGSPTACPSPRTPTRRPAAGGTTVRRARWAAGTGATVGKLFRLPGHDEGRRGPSPRVEVAVGRR